MRTVRVRIALAATLLPLLAGVADLPARPNPHATLDCAYCHFDTPQFGVDTRDTVNFWRAEGDEPKLCERCHGPEANFHPLGVSPGDARMGTRSPEHLPLGKSEAVRGQVVCTTCHDVHASSAGHALLRGFPGAAKPHAFGVWQDLCRECHGSGLEKRSPHGGDDRACAFCHSTKPRPGQPTTVTPVGRRLCESCHGHKDANHYAGVNPFTTPQDCTGCHDPHLGKEHPARLKAGYAEPIRDEPTLNPHRRRTFCFACHADGETASLRAADPTALCQRCHGSGKIPGMSHPLTRVPAGFSIPEGWPLAAGVMTCLTCHLPGHPPGAVAGRADESTDSPHLLRGGVPGDRTAVCFRCHARDQWAGRNPHEDAARRKTGCTQCHARQPVWGEDRAETVTFVADVNIVCLACHNTAEHPAAVAHTVTLTPDMPRVPDGLPLGTGRRITCATCHNPHIDSVAGRRLRGAKEPTAFCQRCHQL